MLQDFIQANQDVRQHSSHLAMQELLAAGPAAPAGETAAPSGEPVPFWSKFDVEHISSEEDGGEQVISSEEDEVPPSKHRASTEPAATPDSSSGAIAKSARSSQEPAAGSTPPPVNLPVRSSRDIYSDLLQHISREVQLMQREFAEGCDDIDSQEVVERITELSTKLDDMNLHDMPELRDCRRKLLHKMDDFCTKVTLKAMGSEEATSAKREGQKHDQPRPKAAKVEEKPDSSRSKKAPFWKGSSVKVKKETPVKVKKETPVKVKKEPFVSSKSKKEAVAKKPARAEAEHSDETVCYIDSPGPVAPSHESALAYSRQRSAAYVRAMEAAEEAEKEEDEEEEAAKEGAEEEGINAKAEGSNAKAEGSNHAEAEVIDEAKAEIDATIAEITQRAITDEWYGKTEVLDVLAKLPRDALPDPAHQHGAKNYTRFMGYASITVRVNQGCFYVKPVPEERVSDRVMQENKLRRDAGNGVNVSFNKFGHTAAWHIAKALALRHPSEKDHVICHC